MKYKLAILASHVGAEISGDVDCNIDHVATVQNADEGAITFVNDSRYRPYLVKTRASAVILTSEFAGDCPVSMLITDRPRLAYAKIATMLYSGEIFASGIHESACVHPDATISESATVFANAVIDAGAVIASNVVIGAGAFIGKNVIIGNATYIHPNVTVCHDCSIGDSCELFPGAVIGADGFGYEKDENNYIKIPQVGSVRIGNNVDIGAVTTIDRGAVEDTVIENGVKLDNHIHIAHNVRVGANTVMASGVGVAGTSTVGANCIIAGHVGVVGHISIADNVTITAKTLVSKSITSAGSYSSGTSMSKTADWRKNSVRFKQLDKLSKRIRQLEKIVFDKKR